jgi:murein DD-endopeptidase MepM/ murein hydrolase activator NlpD
MANKMVANIKSLTTGVDELTRKVNALYESLEKVSSVSTSAMEGATGVLKNNGGSAHLGTAITRPGTGADGATFAPQTYSGPGTNQVNASLGQFSSQGGGQGGGGFPLDPGSGGSRFVQGALGLAKIGLAAPAAAYAGTPDLALTLQRSVGFYQAGLKSPGISRAQLERATFSAMGGGFSSRGSDAAVAALLAGRGYMPGSANYLQTVSQVGGAFKYLGIENAAAADAIAGFQSGPMAANLYQYGITTTDSKGKEKTPGQLVKELIPVLTGGRGYSSAEAVAFSRQKGNLGAFLRENFDAAQQEIVYQGIIDYTEGRNPDLAVRGNNQGGGNANTALTSAGRMSASETKLMMNSEERMIQGFENAADTVEAFNKVLGKVIEKFKVDYIKGLVGGVGGTNVGESLSTGITMLISGIKDLASAITKLPIVGGATSGFGAGFNTGIGPRGGAAANGFGAKDNSGIWASTNNVHTGQDFPMKVGSPVSASLDGYVSSINPGPDYGTAVVIDHPNGYQTVYGHLSERTVNLGEQVKKGQKIGKSGNTGNTTGPHLHYEVRQGKNNPVNPDVLKYFGAESPVGSSSSNYTATSTSTASNTAGSAGVNATLGTGDQQTWASQFLSRIGAPVTELNLKTVSTWMRYEGGHWNNSALYNPLNTTLDMGGSALMDAGPGRSHGVKKYTSMEEGLDATVSTLLGRKSEERGYDAIVNALRNNADSQTVFDLITNSSWGTKIRGGATSGYGASIPQGSVVSGNKTVNITVKFDEANELTAMKFAKQVQKFLNHNNETSMIGNS